MGVDSDNAIEHSCSLIHFTSRCFLARFSFSSPDLVRDILSSSGTLLFLIWFDSLGPINQLFVVLIFITSNRKEIMNYLQNVSLSLEWINIWEEWFAERGLFFAYARCEHSFPVQILTFRVQSNRQIVDCAQLATGLSLLSNQRWPADTDVPPTLGLLHIYALKSSTTRRAKVFRKMIPSS